MRALPLCFALLACAAERSPSDARVDDVESEDAADAGRDADATVELRDADVCDMPHDCPSIAVDVRGQSPLGDVHITRVGVGYWAGFTSGTSLWLEGTAGGQALYLSFAVFEVGRFDDHVPPGSYTGEPLTARASSCGRGQELPGATLEVSAHTAEGPLDAGAEIDFRGVASVADPGWSLRVPFALTRSCDSWIDL